jgi:hypothetical protein
MRDVTRIYFASILLIIFLSLLKVCSFIHSFFILYTLIYFYFMCWTSNEIARDVEEKKMRFKLKRAIKKNYHGVSTVFNMLSFNSIFRFILRGIYIWMLRWNFLFHSRSRSVVWQCGQRDNIKQEVLRLINGPIHLPTSFLVELVFFIL